MICRKNWQIDIGRLIVASGIDAKRVCFKLYDGVNFNLYKFVVAYTLFILSVYYLQIDLCNQHAVELCQGIIL